MIKHGQFYKHKKTERVYCVLEVANECATDKQKWPTTVVYVDDKKRVWAKNERDFIRSFEEVIND